MKLPTLQTSAIFLLFVQLTPPSVTALPSPIQRRGFSGSSGSASSSRSPSPDITTDSSLNNCPVSLLRTGVVLSPKGYIEYRGSYPGSKDILEESTRLVEETWAACFEKDCVTTGINSKHRNPDQRSVPSVQFFKNKLDSRIGYPTTRDLGAKVDWGTEENRQAYFRRFKAIPETQTLPLLNAIFKILVDDRMLYTESATGKQVLEDLPPEWLKHDRAMKSAIRKLQDLAN
ncbi:hypothetical protein EV361DRAFT_889699 [Lentinula raphanica]|nr:hypothetical protein F5880DRAFT_1537546 [Lentinula raphanica]KAJ3975290.1 hypothetical protein EV361DRAFT_889699 [Lentinula raphanica]